MTERADDHATRTVLLVLAAGVALRLAVGGSTGLGIDESYYAVLARHPSASYYEHPPLTMLLAWLAARMGGEAPLVLRLPFILLSAGSTWLLYGLTSRLYGSRAGVIAAILFTIVPVWSLSAGGWILPDGPLVFTQLATMACLVRVLFPRPGEDASAWWWIAAGAWGGLALLSKYSAVFVLAGTGVYLLTTPAARGWLRRPEPWAGMLLALLLFTPVLAWNAGHGWPSVHIWTARFGAALRLRPDLLFAALGSQAVYILPWIWVPMIAALAWGLRRGPSLPRSWFLCCIGVGPIAVVAIPALLGRFWLPHWPSPGYLALVPLLAERAVNLAATHARAVRAWLAGSAAAYVILLAMLGFHAVSGWIGHVAPGLFRRGDPTLDLLDWGPVATAIEPAIAAGAFPAATTWMDAGKLGYALGPTRHVHCLCDDPHHFAFLPGAHPTSSTAIVVGRAGPDVLARRLLPHFDSVVAWPPVRVTRRDGSGFTVSVVEGRGPRASGDQRAP